MSSVDRLLEDLPTSEESRKKVAKWLEGTAMDHNQLDHSSETPEEEDHSQSPQSEDGDQRRGIGDGPNVVSILQKPAGSGEAPLKGPSNTTPKGRNPRIGPPAAHSGSNSGCNPALGRRSAPSARASKRHSTSPSSSRPKRRRKNSGESELLEPSSSESDSEYEGHMTPFDPASLVTSREGTFKPPPWMRKYLDKHLRRCMTKEEREAVFKEHPRPDIMACMAPKPDKYISDFLGKRFPKERDMEAMKIQASVLAIARPLASTWLHLQEAGMNEDPEMLVPASEVMQLVQRTVCLVGNASELISQSRRAHILGTIDHSWSKFAYDQVRAKDTLFGEGFQSKLTGKVEKETVLAKAVSITKNASSRKEGQQNGKFFRQSPAGKYGGRQGRSFPYNQGYRYRSDREGEYPQWKPYPYQARPGQRPQFHEPRLPQNQANPKGSRPQQTRF